MAAFLRWLYSDSAVFLSYVRVVISFLSFIFIFLDVEIVSSYVLFALHVLLSALSLPRFILLLISNLTFILRLFFHYFTITLPLFYYFPTFLLFPYFYFSTVFYFHIYPHFVLIFLDVTLFYSCFSLPYIMSFYQPSIFGNLFSLFTFC